MPSTMARIRALKTPIAGRECSQTAPAATALVRMTPRMMPGDFLSFESNCFITVVAMSLSYRMRWYNANTYFLYAA
jgi:hypothetical protein